MCRWTRRINLQGPERGADVGALHWGATRDILIEDGVTADFSETWERIEARCPEARCYLGPGRERAYLIWSRSWFLFARADPAAMTRPASLVDALEAALTEGRDPLPLFDMEFVLGRWEGRRGAASLSTLPWRAGAPVVERPDRPEAPLVLTRQRPDGTTRVESWALDH